MAPPPPFSIGRFHSHQVNTLYFSLDNERLYSGDSEGYVVCTLTRTFRTLVTWRAHKSGILTIAEWDRRIVTHGRDNKLYVWDQVASLPTVSDTAVIASSSTPTTPSLIYTLDVNALNFCRFSLLLLPPSMKKDDHEVFVAVPNLVDSGLTDVWALPSLARIHAAVGKAQAQNQANTADTALQPDGRGVDGPGILMANHLYLQNIASKPKPQLRLLSAYEAGHVTLFARTDIYLDRSVEGKSWEALWTLKAHVESVMGLSVSSDQTFALTVSADHLIGKYSLLDDLPNGLERMGVYRIKHPGNSAVALRNDGRICAVAGWDGKIRLFSTKSFKALGKLEYHNEAAYAVTFANKRSNATDPEDGGEDGWEPKDSQRRERWLVSTGKEGRVAFWELSSFEK